MLVKVQERTFVATVYKFVLSVSHLLLHTTSLSHLSPDIAPVPIFLYLLLHSSGHNFALFQVI